MFFTEIFANSDPFYDALFIVMFWLVFIWIIITFIMFVRRK